MKKLRSYLWVFVIICAVSSGYGYNLPGPPGMGHRRIQITSSNSAPALKPAPPDFGSVDPLNLDDGLPAAPTLPRDRHRQQQVTTSKPEQKKAPERRPIAIADNFANIQCSGLTQFVECEIDFIDQITQDVYTFRDFFRAQTVEKGKGYCVDPSQVYSSATPNEIEELYNISGIVQTGGKPPESNGTLLKCRKVYGISKNTSSSGQEETYLTLTDYKLLESCEIRQQGNKMVILKPGQTLKINNTDDVMSVTRCNKIGMWSYYGEHCIIVSRTPHQHVVCKQDCYNHPEIYTFSIYMKTDENGVVCALDCVILWCRSPLEVITKDNFDFYSLSNSYSPKLCKISCPDDEIYTLHPFLAFELKIATNEEKCVIQSCEPYNTENPDFSLLFRGCLVAETGAVNQSCSKKCGDFVVEDQLNKSASYPGISCSELIATQTMNMRQCSWSCNNTYEDGTYSIQNTTFVREKPLIQENQQDFHFDEGCPGNETNVYVLCNATCIGDFSHSEIIITDIFYAMGNCIDIFDIDDSNTKTRNPNARFAQKKFCYNINCESVFSVASVNESSGSRFDLKNYLTLETSDRISECNVKQNGKLFKLIPGERLELEVNLSSVEVMSCEIIGFRNYKGDYCYQISNLDWKHVACECIGSNGTQDPSATPSPRKVHLIPLEEGNVCSPHCKVNNCKNILIIEENPEQDVYTLEKVDEPTYCEISCPNGEKFGLMSVMAGELKLPPNLQNETCQIDHCTKYEVDHLDMIRHGCQYYATDDGMGPICTKSCNGVEYKSQMENVYNLTGIVCSKYIGEKTMTLKTANQCTWTCNDYESYRFPDDQCHENLLTNETNPHAVCDETCGSRSYGQISIVPSKRVYVKIDNGRVCKAEICQMTNCQEMLHIEQIGEYVHYNLESVNQTTHCLLSCPSSGDKYNMISDVTAPLKLLHKNCQLEKCSIYDSDERHFLKYGCMYYNDFGENEPDEILACTKTCQEQSFVDYMTRLHHLNEILCSKIIAEQSKRVTTGCQWECYIFKS